MFELQQFIADCRAAVAADSSHRLVREVVARAVSEPARVIAALSEPRRAGIQNLYQSDRLTILNLVWGPRMTLRPHDHRMWAVIGIYTGREDNIFWRRVREGAGSRIEATGAKALSEREAVPLGPDIIHSVTNPIARLTGAIHVYGGDFFNMPRSEWDPETLLERPFDLQTSQRSFEESNAALETPTPPWQRMATASGRSDSRA